MCRTISATSVAFALACTACPGGDGGPSVDDAGAEGDGGMVLDSGVDDAGAGDAGPDDAGTTDGGSVDAGVCSNPASIPTNSCPPGCILEERNVETQTQLEEFAAEEHPFPIDTVNVFSDPSAPDAIVDIAPMASAVFTARSITIHGPSSVSDLNFIGVDASGLLAVAGDGVRSLAFPVVTTLFQLRAGHAELESLALPFLEQAAFIDLSGAPVLCDVDLGAVSAADICDPAQRQTRLNGTCVDGTLQIQSCCAVPFE
jgi:hypothetical protein